MIQHRPYGDVNVKIICRCAGCRHLGGVTVEYNGITSIAKLEDLRRGRIGGK